MDANPCRARTPGFEALGGWLKDDGREVGASRVWMRDTGELSDASSHGARVWKTLTECGVRSNEDHYFSNSSNFTNMIHMESGDVISSKSASPPWEDIPFPEPAVWGEYPHLGRGILDIVYDGKREDGQRILNVSSAGNEGGKRTSHLQGAGFQLALQEFDKPFGSLSAAILVKAKSASQRIAGCAAAVRFAATPIRCACSLRGRARTTRSAHRYPPPRSLPHSTPCGPSGPTWISST